VGHTRYSTAGGSFLRNIQPMFADLDQGGIAIGHNGNLTNFHYPAEPAGRRGLDLPVHLGLRSHPSPDRPLRKPRSSSASSTPWRGSRAATPSSPRPNQDDRRARPLGIRPLVLGGQIGEAWVLASETCALDTIGATFVRDVEHGEVIVIDHEGLRSIKPFPAQPPVPACSNTSTSRAPTAS
jgi:amidophosphoribosyltransferase